MKENDHDRGTEIKLEGFENTLKKDLENYKNEGNALYREGKIEEAKLKFKEGYELYKQDFRKIKKSADKKVLEEVHLLFKKILSNLALCYYKQGEYKESIKYDTELLLAYPKFGKSIVRILKAYTKLKDNPNAVIYGEQFLELDKETRDKFKGTQDIVQEEKLKLKKKQEEERERQKKDEEKQRKINFINSIKIQNCDHFLINEQTNETLSLNKKKKKNLKLDFDKINFEVSILSNLKNKKRLSKGINTNINTFEEVSTVDNFTIIQKENNIKTYINNEKKNINKIKENENKIIKKEIEIEIDKEKEKSIENKKELTNEINFNFQKTFLKLNFNTTKENKKSSSLDFSNIYSNTKKTHFSMNDETKRNFSPLSQNELTSNLSKSLISSSNLKNTILKTERKKNDYFNNIISINNYLGNNSQSFDNIHNYSMNKKNNLNLSRFEYISPINDKYYKQRKVFYLNNDSNIENNNLKLNSEQNGIKIKFDKYKNLIYKIQVNEEGNNNNKIMPPNPYLSVLEAREKMFCNK